MTFLNLIMPDHMISDDADKQPSTAVYLCQVSERVSCGACCGLYNVSNLSRDDLEDRLKRRAEQFAHVSRTEDDIEHFRRETEGWSPEDRPFPDFHHCPFIGMIGENFSRVGCMLHPAAPGNNGQDYRYLSYYGAKACRSYFCPSAKTLAPRYQIIIRELIEDWFDYGLIITEHRLLKALFTEIEALIDRPVSPGDFPTGGRTRFDLQALLVLKLSWPYQRVDSQGPCHFPFDNGLYSRPELQWPTGTRSRRRFQAIFRELESAFLSESDVLQAERILNRPLRQLVQRLE